MPDRTQVGRRYSAPGQVVNGDRARQMAVALAGSDAPPQPDAVPPTFAAVYCMAPAMAQVFTDPEMNLNLAGLIHGEQSFEWPAAVHAGDVVDAAAEIESVDQKRGMTFVTVTFEATRQADSRVVCRGRSLMIVRGAS